jgi:hypothetical protein
VKPGNYLAQQFKSFAGGVGLLDRQARDVTAGLRQARNQTGTNRIHCNREHDGDGGDYLLYFRDGGTIRDDHIDLEADELDRNVGDALRASLSPAILDRDSVALDPTELA